MRRQSAQGNNGKLTGKQAKCRQAERPLRRMRNEKVAQQNQLNVYN